jgi:2'-5' RNA ligase
MRATFVLLTDWETQNFMRKLAVELDTELRTGLTGSLLPAHVSLKQPFQITDLHAVETYFDQWATTIRPFGVRFTGLGFPFIEQASVGIVWLDVEETALLRGLHNGLNTGLAEHFERTEAPFDGSQYQFHATVAVGPWSHEVHEKLTKKYEGLPVRSGFRVREVAMFYYAADDFAPGTFTAYKIVPVHGIASNAR